MTNAEIQDHQRAQIDKLHRALQESYLHAAKQADMCRELLNIISNISSPYWADWINTAEGSSAMMKFNAYSCLQAELNEG